MSIISVTSSRTSPGATSLAAGLAIAAAARTDASLLVEADPAGGMVSLRFGLAPQPSLATFGTDTRNNYTHELLWQNTQNLRGAHCIPGPVDPRVAASWSEYTGQILAEKVSKSGAAVFIDLGRLEPGAPNGKIATGSDLTIVVTRPSIAEIQSMLFQVEQLKAEGANLALVTVGSRPHDPHEVAALAGIPLLATLPDDPVAAAVLKGGDMPPKKFKRTQLWRVIDGIAASCLATWPVQPPVYIPNESAELNDELIAAPATPGPAMTPGQLPAPTAQPAPAQPVAEEPAARPNPVPRVVAAEVVTDDVVNPAPAVAPAAPVPAPEPAVAAAPPVPPVPAATPAPAAVEPNPFDNPAIVPTPVAGQDPNVVMSPAPDGWPDAAGPEVAAPAPVAQPGQSDRVVIPQIREEQQPAPAVAAQAHATLVSADGSRCVLPSDRTLVLGRDTDSDISINDRLISRAHAHLRPTGDGWLFIDLGSTNGSMVNGQRVSQMLLSPGDELTLGKTSIVFSPSERVLESA